VFVLWIDVIRLGKTYLANQLRQSISAEPHSLSVAVLSIDDLYLPHFGLEDIAQRYSDNKLLQGRGLPGTHDIALGTQILQRMKEINTEGSEPASIEIPSFDKSLYDGRGDRLPNGTTVASPIDVVIFEGWFVGFTPSTLDELERRHRQEIPDLEGLLDIQTYSLEEIKEINERLEEYVGWWKFFDTFIQVSTCLSYWTCHSRLSQIKPPEEHPYAYIYAWRLEQEHSMKAKNGGKGMSDEQVKR
jgi:D-glycerate 3-kinase